MKKYRLLWFIIIAAATVRLVYFLQVRDNFLFQNPVIDAKYYHEWAVEMANGDWLSAARPGVYMMSPGYSFYLAAVYAMFGANVTVAVGSQFLLGIATGFLVFLLARRYFSAPAGYTAAALYLFSAPALFYEGVPLKVSLINFLNMAALFAAGGAGLAWQFAAGALLGFSAHLRPNVLALAPLFLAVFWKAGGGKWLRMAVFALGCSIVLLPVAFRNLHYGGEFVLTTAHGGMNFFTGNSPYCLGPYTPMPFARTDPEVEQADFMEEAFRRSKKLLTPRESSAFWYGESLRYIRQKPFDWLKLQWRKTLIFFNDYEPPINLDFYFFSSEYNSVLSYLPVRYGLILPLAAAGVAMSPFQLLLGGYIVIYFLVTIVFFVVSEYRFPVVPVLCIFAGQALVVMFANRKNVWRLAAGGAIAAVFFVVSNYDIYAKTFNFPSYRRANLANSYFGLGVTYESKKMSDEAVRAYENAVKIMPQAAPLINLANIYESKGDLDRAQLLIEQALRLQPASGEALNNLGAILSKKRRYAEAAACFERALILNPGFKQAGDNLAIVRKLMK